LAGLVIVEWLLGMGCNLSALQFLIYINFSWIQQKMQPRIQNSAARVRGEFNNGQSAKSSGYRGSTSSLFSSHSLFEMIELAARRAPSEKFNGQVVYLQEIS
jgi:hypothetical protein